MRMASHGKFKPPSVNNVLILTFLNKIISFLSKFDTNLGLFLEFYQKNDNQFKDAFMSFRSVSSDVSNCIVLKFIYAKFQVSSSVK